MSKEAMQWAGAQRVSDITLSTVLKALAYFANRGTAECCKSQGEIAREIGASVRTVRHALAVLERLEIISRRARSNGFSGRTTDAVKLSIDRNFDVSKGAIVAIRKALQPAKSAVSKENCNRQNLPLQPAKSAGEDNTVNTEDTLSVGITSVGREGTYTPEGHGWRTSDWYHDLPANVTPLRARGGAA